MRPALAAFALLTAGSLSAQEVTTGTTATGGDIVGYRSIHQPEIGRGGMVVSQNEIATRVGVEVLRRGGNAVDAAVAVGFAAAVTLPRAGNIGGGGYMLIHMAATPRRPAETIAIDYYGQASRNTTPDLLIGADGKMDAAKVMSMKGVTIPGTVGGLWEAHRRYGSRPWRSLIAPAIALAEQGVTLSDDEAKAHADQARLMADDPAALAIFFRPDGRAFRPGDRFRQRDLAATLRTIANRGPDGFYKGALAARIVAGIKGGGGVIDAQDMADYRAIVSAPIVSTYRGTDIAYMPPTASGATVAQAMNILERYSIGSLGWGSAAGLHLIAEAVKIATADRRLIGGGPDWRTPVAGLTSKAFAAERAGLIRPDAVLTAKTLPPGDPARHESPDTTHYSVADRFGNAVSNTYTLSASYGAHVVAPGTGVLLNNSLGNLNWGGRSQALANEPVPGKRVGSTITPIIAFRDGRPWLVTGTPGGGTIVATMVQLLSNVLDHRLNIAEAAMRPRLNQGSGDAALELEDGFSPDVVALLRARGHRIRASQTMGSTQSILIEGDRFEGAADTRRPDALALAVDP